MLHFSFEHKKTTHSYKTTSSFFVPIQLSPKIDFKAFIFKSRVTLPLNEITVIENTKLISIVVDVYI